MNDSVLVIGAGIGGIAVAIELASQGLTVDVYEQADKPGGKLNQIEVDGFRFDTGPSLFTLPSFVDSLFVKADATNVDFKYRKLDNLCRYHFSDGTVLNAFSSTDLFVEEVEKVLDEPKENVQKYLKKVKQMYDMAAGVFILKPFPSWETFTSKAGQKLGLQIHKLDMLLSMHQRNKRSFRNKNLIQLFDRYATYNGSNPYKAPATLNMIAHLEHNDGAYFPEKGMYSIVENLVEEAIKKGVRFHYGKRVEQVVFYRKHVSGAYINGEFVSASRIVSDVDVTSFYRNLMPKKRLPLRLKIMNPSSSACVFYWGMNKTFDSLDLHNIFFAENYHEEFNFLFKKKELYHDPTVYVFISNKITKTDAPENSENWFVMVNAPANKGQYSDEKIAFLRKAIIKKLSLALGVDIEQNIISESVGSPMTIEQQTSSVGGAIYGSNSNSRISAFLRHPNKLKRYKGLYFVGGSVHPGGGIPLCIASAQIVSEYVRKEMDCD